MTKYYNKEIPTEIHVVYGGRQSGKTYYELKKLKEENERLNELVQFNVKTTSVLTKRINKAIEYIKENANYSGISFCSDLRYDECLFLLKILKGEENE